MRTLGALLLIGGALVAGYCYYVLNQAEAADSSVQGRFNGMVDTFQGGQYARAKAQFKTCLHFGLGAAGIGLVLLFVPTSPRTSPHPYPYQPPPPPAGAAAAGVTPPPPQAPIAPMGRSGGAAPVAVAGTALYAVRVNGQDLGLMRAEQVRGRAKNWQRPGVVAEIAAAGTGAFQPLAQWLANPPRA